MKPLYGWFAVTLLSCAAAYPQIPSMEARCRGILQEELKDHNPETRKQAVVALSLAGYKEPFFSLLVSMLADKDVPVRQSVVASLAEIPGERATAALRKALDDEVPEVSFAAAKALWGRRAPVGKQALLSVLEGETKTSSSFFSKQKRDTLRMMQTPKGMFLFALRNGIGFTGVPGVGEGLASMQGLLADPGVSGRATAALLLGNENDSQTIRALREALSDKEWSVRAAAIHSLALRNDKRFQKDFLPLLDDKKAAVRLRAAAAYLRLQGLRGRSPAPVAASSAPAPRQAVIKR